MHHRLSNILRERTDFLKGNVDKYLVAESKALKDLNENLDLELQNIKVRRSKMYFQFQHLYRT
jgi:hypothetical protein